MEALLAKEAFESKKPAIVALFDRKLHSALDLLTSFILHRSSVSPSAFIHLLCFERKPRFWKARLEEKLRNRIAFYDFWYDAFGWNNPDRLLEADAVIQAVQRNVHSPECSASSSDDHIVVFDASTLLLLTIPANQMCMLLVTIPEKITEERGCAVSSCVVVLHHCDVFEEYSELALKAISSCSISVASTTQTPRNEKEFLCAVTSKSHQTTVLKKMEKVIVNNHWVPRFEKAEAAKPGVDVPHRAELLERSPNNRKLKKTLRVVGKTFSKTPDPTANIPFNLRLTDEERAARTAVPLPHTKGASVIYYEPDEADDVDYEDPDE